MIPTQRRLLPLGRLAIWIDDEGSCPGNHVVDDNGRIWWSPWHKFREVPARPSELSPETIWTPGPDRLTVIRCPSTLTDAERTAMIQDIPPGSWARQLAAKRDR